jgi:hypothetical protein
VVGHGDIAHDHEAILEKDRAAAGSQPSLVVLNHLPGRIGQAGGNNPGDMAFRAPHVVWKVSVTVSSLAS